MRPDARLQRLQPRLGDRRRQRARAQPEIADQQRTARRARTRDGARSEPGASADQSRRQRVDADRRARTVIAVTIATPVAIRRAREPRLRRATAARARRTGAARRTRSASPIRRRAPTARLARERDQQRRAVDGQQDAQDRAEVAQIRQCGRLRRLSYNPLHNGRDMQASCRMPACADVAGHPADARRVPARVARRRLCRNPIVDRPPPRGQSPRRENHARTRSVVRLPTPPKRRSPPPRCRRTAHGRAASASRCPSGCSASTRRSTSTGALRAPISRGSRAHARMLARARHPDRRRSRGDRARAGDHRARNRNAANSCGQRDARGRPLQHRATADRARRRRRQAAAHGALAQRPGRDRHSAVAARGDRRARARNWSQCAARCRISRSVTPTTIMPGFTHLQVAQPVTFGHHLMAYDAMFARDVERLRDCRRRVNRLPLGSAALAGHELSRSIASASRASSASTRVCDEFARRGVRSRLRDRVRGGGRARHGAPVALRRGARAVVEPALRVRRARRSLLHRQLDHAAEEESRRARARARQERRASSAT